MLFQVAKFNSFYGWIVFPSVYKHIYFIDSLLLDTLGRCHILTSVNNVAVNIWVHVSFWICVFFEYISRSLVYGKWPNISPDFSNMLHYITHVVVLPGRSHWEDCTSLCDHSRIQSLPSWVSSIPRTSCPSTSISRRGENVKKCLWEVITCPV